MSEQIVVDLGESFDNLAMAAMASKEMMVVNVISLTTLAATNATLTADNKRLNATTTYRSSSTGVA